MDMLSYVMHGCKCVFSASTILLNSFDEIGCRKGDVPTSKRNSCLGDIYDMICLVGCVLLYHDRCHMHGWMCSVILFMDMCKFHEDMLGYVILC